MITVKPSHYTSSQRFIFKLTKTHKQNLTTFHQHKYSTLGNACIAFSSFASAETPQWDHSKIIHDSNGNGNGNTVRNRTCKEEEEDEEEEEEEEEEFGDKLVVLGGRKVKCEVEVISWRERRIKAEISVNADVGSVWFALTDYERLADFIPNLVSRLN